MIWNAAFLLKANEFRTLIDSLRGQPLLEGLVRVDARQQERFLRKVLRDTQAQSITKQQAQKQQQKQQASLFHVDDQDGEQSNEKAAREEEREQAAALSEELRFHLTTAAELQQTVQQDNQLFLQQWQDGLEELNQVHYVIDHAQLLDKDDDSVLNMLEDHRQHRQSKRVYRSPDGQPIHSIEGAEAPIEIPMLPDADASELPALTETLAAMLPWLSALSRFDQGVVELLASLHQSAWTDEDWFQLGQMPWIEPQSRNWVSVSKVTEIKSLFTPHTLDDFKAAWRTPLLDYLQGYGSADPQEQDTAQLDFLSYALHWQAPQAAENWLHFWLQALSKSRFDLAEQTLAVGEAFEAPLLQTVAPQSDNFQHGIFSIRQLIKDFVLQPPQTALTKKQQKKQQKQVWQDIEAFCLAATALNLAADKKLVAFAAAQQVLQHITLSQPIGQPIWQAFLKLCSAEATAALFAQTRSSYLLFLIDLYEQQAAYSNRLSLWKAEFITLSAASESERHQQLIARFQLELEQWPAALVSFRQLEAITTAPETKTACRKSILFLLQKLDRQEEVQTMLEALLAEGTRSTEQQAKIWLRLSTVVASEQEKQQALARAFALDPVSSEITLTYCIYLLEQDNQQLIDQLLKSCAAADKAAGLALGQGQQQKIKNLLQGFKLLEADKPEQALPLLAASFPQADLEVERGKIETGNVFLKVMQLQMKGEFRQAQQLLKKEIKAKGESPELLWLLLELQLHGKSTGSTKAAKATLKALAALLEGFIDQDRLRIAGFYGNNNRFKESLLWLDAITAAQCQNKDYFALKINALESQDGTDSRLQQTLTAALAQYSTQVDFLISQGYYFGRQGQCEQALATTEKITNLSPKNWKGWGLKGAALVDLKRPQAALTCINTAIELNPKLALSWRVKGRALQALNHYQQALDSYDQAIKLDAKDADTWYNKGLLLDNLNRQDEAVNALDQAIQLNPKHNASGLKAHINHLAVFLPFTLFSPFLNGDTLTPNHINTAIANYSKGLGERINRDGTISEKQALESVAKSAQNEPTSVTFHVIAGMTRLAFNRYSESLESFNHAMQLNPDDLRVWHLIAHVHWRLHQFADCLVAIAQILRLAPDQPDFLLRKIALLLILGKEAESQQLLTGLLQQHPEKLPEAHYTQAVAYALLNRKTAALSWLNKVLAANAESVESTESKEQIRQRIQQDDDFAALRALPAFQALLAW